MRGASPPSAKVHHKEWEYSTCRCAKKPIHTAVKITIARLAIHTGVKRSAMMVEGR
jgi:hypothetical protein